MNENIMIAGLLFLYITGFSLWLMNGSAEPANRVSRRWRFKRKLKQIAEREGVGKKFLMKYEAGLQKKKKNQIDREIFNSSVLLKNLAIAEKGRAFSADYIYERLLEHSGKLRPVYGKMISLYRSGKDQEAWKLMGNLCGTRAAKNFSMILSKLNQIDPAELIEQMEVFQEAMEQERTSREVKEIQKNGLIAASFAFASAFALLINFAAAVVLVTMTDLMTTAF